MVATDLAQVVTVRVTGTLATYVTTAKDSVGSATVASGVFTVAPTPAITGTPISGQTLTAVAGTWSPAAALTYQWFAGSDLVGSAASLRVTAAMAGKQITVTVTGSVAGYTTQTKNSVATALVRLPVIAPAPVPTITGTVKVGQTLTATEGTWAAGTSFAYQWSQATTSTGVYSNITDATAKTFVVGAGTLGTFVKVTVTGKKAGNADTPKTSLATIAVVVATFGTAPTPSITGSTAVGATLTANEGAWLPSPDSFTYQWKVSLTSGGTYSNVLTNGKGRTYVLQSGDNGKFFKVTVTALKAGFTTVTSPLSLPTTVITQPSLSATFTSPLSIFTMVRK